MSKEKVFCERCGQKIIMGGLLKKGMECFEFKDGFYCAPCGKLQVEEARNKKKDKQVNLE